MATEGYTYAHWKLNESSGTNVPDTSGNSRDGTTVNSPTWVAGQLNNALQFNGSTQHVTFGDTFSLERDHAFSIEFWIKFSLNGTYYVISKWDSSISRGMYIYVAAGKVYLGLATSATNYLLCFGGTILNDGTFKHVVITYNGNSLVSGVTMYASGAAMSKTTSSNNLDGSIINSNDLELARRSTGNYLNGTLDEFVLYDYELTSAQVRMRYNGGTGREDFPFDMTSDYVIRGPISVNINSDYRIVNRIQQGINSNYYIKRLAFSDTILFDSFIKKIGTTNTINADSYILKSYTNTLDSNSYIIVSVNKSINSDYSTLQTISEVILSNYSIAETKTEQINGDYYIKDIVDNSINSETYILRVYDQSLNSNYNVTESLINPMYSDYMVKSAGEWSDTWSVFTYRAYSKTIDSNYSILAGSGPLMYSDYYILATQSDTIDSYEYIKATNSGTINSNYEIRSQGAYKPCFKAATYVNKPVLYSVSAGCRN